jgi:hypothetical protein
MPTIDWPIGWCCIAFQRCKGALIIRCATCGSRLECAANYQREPGPAPHADPQFGCKRQPLKTHCLGHYSGFSNLAKTSAQAIG